MATVEDLFAALKAADAAGNTEDATKIAQYLSGLGYGPKIEAAPPKKETGFKDYLKDIPKAVGRGATGLLETSAIGASALLPEDYEKSVRAGIESLAKPTREYLAPATPEIGESVSSKLLSGVGSTLPFFVAGPLGLAGRVGAGALGVSAGAGEARQAAEQAGATPEEISRATALGAPTGMLDILAPNIGPLKSIFTTALARGGVEGLTEAAQKVAQNYIAKGVYDPKKDVLEGSGEEGVYGAGVGALTSLLVDLTLGRRAKGAVTPPPERPPTAVAAPEAPAALGLPSIEAQPVQPGFSAQQAQDLRQEAEQLEQMRQQAIEQNRLDDVARIEAAMLAQQERVAGMSGFTRSDGNVAIRQAMEERRQAEEDQVRAEAVAAERQRQAQIRQIQAATFDPDPVRNELIKRRELERLGAGPAAPAAPAEPAAPAQLEEPAGLYGKREPLETEPQAKPRGVQKFEFTPEEQAEIKSVKESIAAINKDITAVKAQKTSLFKVLEGKLTDRPGAIGLADIDMDKKSLRRLYNKEGRGALLEDMVEDGALDDFLPPENRKLVGGQENPRFDSQAAIEHIAGKLRSGDYTSEIEAANLAALEQQRDAAKAELEKLETLPAINRELAAGRRPAEPSLQDLMEEAANTGLDVEAIKEDVARRMPDATQQQYLGALHGALTAATNKDPIVENLYQQTDKKFTGYNPTPNGTRIQKELEGKSFDQLVQWNINNAPNRFQKLVAQKVKAMVEALRREGVQFHFDLQGGSQRNVRLRGAEGVTTFTWGQDKTDIYVQLNGEPVIENQNGYPSGMSYDTIAHELLHVATRSATRFLPANHPLIKDLRGLFNSVVDQFNKDAKAGTLPEVLQKFYQRRNNVLESPDEMITWGLTDRDFQNYLSNINVGPKQTAFSKFVELIREMLGLAKPFETAMEKLVRTTESILEIDVNEVKAGMVQYNVVFGKAAAPTTAMQQQSLLKSERLLRDDLSVRREGFFFDAKNSPLYQTRTDAEAKPVGEKEATDAIMSTKVGKDVMGRNNKVKDGDYVGVRLDLNILRATGVPVQSVHQGKEALLENGAGFYSGEILKYVPHATLRNVHFKVQQTRRENIAVGKEQKSKMGSADGQWVDAAPNYDGIELRFNPRREHLFRDALGRAVKYADEITTTGNKIFARGRIEYYGEEDVPARAGTAPTEARVMQVMESVRQTGNVSTPIQESLFMQNGNPPLAANEPMIRETLAKAAAAPARTQMGEDAMEMLEGIGRSVAPPEPGYIQKVRQSWDNARDNPKATREAAYGAFRKFADQVETWSFSSDAALNNQIRREVMNSMVGNEQKIGMLLNTSLSQTAHSDAIANLFLMEGNIKYDTELNKWVGVKDDRNIFNLSKKLDEMAEKAGLTKQEIELISHTAFEARRTQGLIDFNADIDARVEAMRAEAAATRAAGKPVAAHALSEKAQALLGKKKVTKNMSPEEIQAGLKFFEMFPGLNEVADIWNGMRENALKVMVDTGLYTEQEANMLLDVADYVPFYREDQIEEGKGPKEFLRSLSVQADKRLKGSAKPVNDIFDNMVRWTQYAINRGVRNRSAVALATTAEQVGLAERVEDSKAGDNVVRVWQNGEQTYYNMADPLFMSAFRGLESVAIPTVKVFSKMADVLRQSVVLYPLFSIAQVPQDSFAAMFTSGLKPQYALSIPFRAVKEFIQTLRGKSKAHEELKNIGAVGVRDFTSAVIRADAEIFAGLKQDKSFWAGVKRKLGNLAMAADNAVRQATFEAAEAQGLSKAEAYEKAFEIFNVRRRGNSKMLALAGQVIPFFNAYLAAQHVAYRTLTGVGTSPTERKAAFQTLAATTGSVMALSVLYAMMNGDDDDYLNKPTPTRDRLLMIPGTGGFSIPLRADIFALPKVLAEHTYLLLTDNGYQDSAKFRSSIASLLANSIFSPTPVPQAIKPLAEAIINFDFFQQKPLVGVFQQRKDLSRQFEASTSEFSKLLGQTEMISPIVADHLIRGMFGSFGGLFLYMTNPILADMAGKPRPALSFQDALATIPNASGFVSKEYESALRKDFYALQEATGRAASTLSDLKRNSPQDVADYLSDETTRQRINLAPFVNNIATKLTDIRNSRNVISQLPEDKMDEDEKQARIKKLLEDERKLLQGVNLKRLREMANL